MRSLTIGQARRTVLGAQGLDREVAPGRVDVRHLRGALARNHVVQLDSVNVNARAHYLPFLSRLGPYDPGRLDRWLWHSRETFEYPAHEASVQPVALHPLLRHRMAEGHRWGIDHTGEDREYAEDVLAQVAERGPLTVRDLDDAGGRGGSWWGWSSGRAALDWLYARGDIAVHHRDATFALHYDLTERVIPTEILALPTPTREEAQRELVRLAARACGVATARDLVDHFRLPIPEGRAAVAALVAAGELEPVRVEGWRDEAYLSPGARRPRRTDATALLSPFDPLVWFRPRAERLFDFTYRIEIYVPKAKRQYGYYVLPFLFGDRIAARVDLKSDRRAGALLVLGAWAEEHADRPAVARSLASRLREFATWQGLSEVAVSRNGDLADLVARHA